MELELLTKTLEVATVSGVEDNMVNYLTSFGIKHGITVLEMREAFNAIDCWLKTHYQIENISAEKTVKA